MYTPIQLRDRLLEVGIHRDLRALTDWRQKGLLPALVQTSAGRGKGVKRYWKSDVLDQAIAVDWLLTNSQRADEALFGLWLSGYPVDPNASRLAWLQHLNALQHRRQKAASRYAGSFVGLGQSWSRKLFANPQLDFMRQEHSPRFLELAGQLLGDAQEWLRDDIERDDSAFRDLISQLIAALTNADFKGVCAMVDEFWDECDPASFLPHSRFFAFVESLSEAEMALPRQTLAHVRQAIQYGLNFSGTLGPIERVVFPMRLMRDFLGAPIAAVLILVSQYEPVLPIEGSISTLCDHAIGVQSIDITHKSDGGIVFSDRVCSQWESTKKQLSVLWTAPKTTK